MINTYLLISLRLSYPKLKDVTVDEMHALEKNGTWDLLDLRAEKHTLSCKWYIFLSTIQMVDGSIPRYEARLLVKGLTQAHSIDCLEAFSTVANLNSIR